jgi:hypothetical protein
MQAGMNFRFYSGVWFNIAGLAPRRLIRSEPTTRGGAFGQGAEGGLMRNLGRIGAVYPGADLLPHPLP